MSSIPLGDQAATVLSARSISKRYGPALALDEVSFDLREGEILALLGENGAGKSTLMKILAGLTAPSNGEIALRGQAVKFAGPKDASQAGIGMVHQHFQLVPAFSVLDNLALDDSSRNPSLIRTDSLVARRSQEIMDRIGWSIPLDRRVSDLPVGTQQRVEILKTLLADAQILLFDEPTAVLAPSEIDGLFTVLRSLREQGRSIVFVSHKLGEVMDLCDRVTVLRRGKNVGTVDIADTNTSDLAVRMVGSEAESVLDERPEGAVQQASGDIVLKALNMSANSTDRSVALSDLSFDLKQGEVLGFAGVDGNGQTELAELLTGTRAWISGSLAIHGSAIARLRPSDLVRYSIGYIPPDRQREGLALGLSVAENLSLDANQVPQFHRGPFLNFKALQTFAKETASAFDIRTARIDLPAGSLSGGNQQKIVIARALWKKPDILIAVSPTRGLDVAARSYVHQQIRQRQSEGGAVVLISTELEEIFALSTRIAVLYDGRIIGIVPADTSRETIGLMMGGQTGSGAS